MLDFNDQVAFRGEIIKAKSAISRDISRKSSLTVDSSFLVPFMPMDQFELHSLFHRIPIGFHCVSGDICSDEKSCVLILSLFNSRRNYSVCQ